MNERSIYRLNLENINAEYTIMFIPERVENITSFGLKFIIKEHYRAIYGIADVELSRNVLVGNETVRIMFISIFIEYIQVSLTCLSDWVSSYQGNGLGLNGGTAFCTSQI